MLSAYINFYTNKIELEIHRKPLTRQIDYPILWNRSVHSVHNIENFVLLNSTDYVFSKYRIHDYM